MNRVAPTLFTGGGTGGHTYPALTAVRTLQKRLEADFRVVDVLWIGTAEGLEARVAPAEASRSPRWPQGKSAARPTR